MTKTTSYAVKDDQGNYVGANSISYDGKSGGYLYSCSRFVTNGFYTYGSFERAKKCADNLNEIAKNIGFDRVFYVQEINLANVILEESKVYVPDYRIQDIVVNAVKKELASA